MSRKKITVRCLEYEITNKFDELYRRETELEKLLTKKESLICLKFKVLNDLRKPKLEEKKLKIKATKADAAYYEIYIEYKEVVEEEKERILNKTSEKKLLQLKQKKVDQKEDDEEEESDYYN